MGLLNYLFGDNRISSTGKRKHPIRFRKAVKIGFIIHTKNSAEHNGRPVKKFTNGHNASTYAKEMSKRWHTTVYVYKVNLNSYSLGTGDDIGTERYGVFSIKQYRGQLCQ